MTITELCDKYQAWADDYYRLPNEQGVRVPTREAYNIRHALATLREIAGSADVSKLSAEMLECCQQRMIASKLARNTINARINRIRRMVKWAARPPRRWVETIIVRDLELLEPLRWGRCNAAEARGMQPVTWEKVTSTMQYASRALYAAIEVHWLTGMRCGELVRMRRSELTTEKTPAGAEVMVYRPTQHKTKHCGCDRNIFIGPEGRRVLTDWMNTHNRDRLWTCTVDSYRRSVIRINRREILEPWTPAQIRHAFASRMRDKAGIDVVQVLMGHRHRTTTEIYAKPDAVNAVEAIARHG